MESLRISDFARAPSTVTLGKMIAKPCPLTRATVSHASSFTLQQARQIDQNLFPAARFERRENSIRMVQLESNERERKPIGVRLTYGIVQGVQKSAVILQSRKLVTRREVDQRLIAPFQFPGARVQNILRGNDPLGGFERDLKFGRIDGFGEKVISTRIQPLDSLMAMCFRGQQNHVDVPGSDLCPDLAAKFKATHLGHHPVRNHEPLGLALKVTPGLGPSRGDHDVVPHRLETPAQIDSLGETVLGDQDSHRNDFSSRFQAGMGRGPLPERPGLNDSRGIFEKFRTHFGRGAGKRRMPNPPAPHLQGKGADDG